MLFEVFFSAILPITDKGSTRLLKDIGFLEGMSLLIKTSSFFSFPLSANLSALKSEFLLIGAKL